MKKFISTIIVMITMMMSPLVQAGFKVEGTQLIDANGNPFVMRGINHPHAWYRDKLNALADIAATGANSARIVLAYGQQWHRTSGNEVERIIASCKRNKLVCILEVHDATGSGEASNAGTIAGAVDYWLSDDIKQAMAGEEDYIILNIANEPFGNGVPQSVYVYETKQAITRLRDAGYKHTLMVDAANWGQDWQGVMRKNATSIFKSDPKKNVIFDVHMYEVYKDYWTIRNYMRSFASQNLHLVIGEFASEHYGKNVDEDSIMTLAEDYGFGYLGWSWSGNGDCCKPLDVVQSWQPGNYTPWGDKLINGRAGIKATSIIASIYEGQQGPGPEEYTHCEWSNDNIWPLCETDTGGWGWENNQSCISLSICPTPL